VVGRQLWIATRDGLAVYDANVDGLRSFGESDGLGSSDVAELIQVGDDLWCRTAAGLSRLRIQAKSFTNFGFAEIGGEELRAFTIDGERIWVGTVAGLFSFEPTADTFVPFPQQAVLESARIVGVETFTDYLFITTEKEIVQFHKTSRAIRRYAGADGLKRTEGATGTVLEGGLLTVLFTDGAEVYDVQRDLWTSRTFEPNQSEASTLVRVFGAANAEVPYDLARREASPNRFSTAEAGFGLGHRFRDGSSLEAALRLDYGQLELEGIRALEYRLQYLGKQTDWLREIRASDREEVRTPEEGIERSIPIRGAHARVSSPEDSLQATVDLGLRRGNTARDFISGARRDVYALSKHHILPGSESVWLDGARLTAGTDYTVIYPAGQLFFLDPER
ncbi:MAG: hypothetical protein HYZ27_06245, partial [Deltaproteobacteria bacterium]|nr:hypothetical protein [Deltaproteobacteria bacterium]